MGSPFEFPANVVTFRLQIARPHHTYFVDMRSNTENRSVLVSDQAPQALAKLPRETCSQRSFEPVKQPQNLATDPAATSCAAAAAEAFLASL